MEVPRGRGHRTGNDGAGKWGCLIWAPVTSSPLLQYQLFFHSEHLLGARAHSVWARPAPCGARSIHIPRGGVLTHQRQNEGSLGPSSGTYQLCDRGPRMSPPLCPTAVKWARCRLLPHWLVGENSQGKAQPAVMTVPGPEVSGALSKCHYSIHRRALQSYCHCHPH